MFDIDDFITDCLAARAESESLSAIKTVLDRALAQCGDIADALPPTRAEAVPSYVSDELSVLKAVWAPGMGFRPHNHLMWAAIGVYTGQEDNTLYRRTDHGIAESGGRVLRAGDVGLFGDDTIHAVANPKAAFTAALHVYGGDITQRPGRSEWDENTLDEVDYDFERIRRYFDEANSNPTA